MAITIEMPRLSDSMHEGIVLRWVKKIGDFVEVGDHLADIETDKAHVELQACEDGTLMEILVPEGGSAAVGAPIALLQSEFGAASCDCPPCPPVKCSPLAARLAAEAGLNAGTLRGTGPRGKIMAADVRASIRPADGPARRVQTPLAPRDTRHATRVDNFYLYSLEANMAYLAAISTPIAVQCEKLIGGRYSLFDYVVRAAVKACISEPETPPQNCSWCWTRGKNTSLLKTPPARRFTTSPWNGWPPPRQGRPPRAASRPTSCSATAA